MDKISYIGESLWLGNIAHFAIILGFVTGLLSVFSYFKATVQKSETNQSWLKIGRYSFYIHGVSIFTLIGLIFYAMYNQMYEYSYVFDHVSPDLPMKYILSAFWEGQEGSFMLWMFWHIVLGAIFIRTNPKWESPVMFIIVLAEVILLTMILGLHINIGDETYKIGSNPTVLLRQITEAPIFSNADYLSLIKGRGLNPLLQNYWMTIHPPTLFLGFASTIIPFGFAFAGLWKNDHKGWLQPALGWSLFSAGFLGIGILMGSFWAYEALSFGGYWNWDPVENASLVPWITLVAGIHTHLIAKHTGYATRSTYFYYLISFVLILYSTFMTRSGILGDTSAHAFTEMGLEWQLIFLVGFFFLLGIGLWGYKYKSIQSPKREESLYSKEFWMYIGSLVLIFGAILITISTSLPVYNKIMTLFDPLYSGKVIKDPVEHYNKYQLWIAVFVALISSTTIFLRYNGANWAGNKNKFFKRIIITALISFVATIVCSYVIKLYAWQYYMFAFAGFFALIANGDYIINVIKFKLKLASSGIAHLGFGLMLIGLLGSGLNSFFISSNPFVFKGMFTDEDVEKYVQLIKGKPLFSKGYFITYENDTLIGNERKYAINFKKLTDSLQVVEEFTLYPNSVYSNDFSKVAAFNPDTKHYLHKDIFTCVVALPLALQNVEEAKKIEDSLKFEKYFVELNDSLRIGTKILVPNEISYTPTQIDYLKHEHDTGVSLKFTVLDTEKDTSYQGETALGLDGALLYKYPEAIEALGMRFRVDEELMSALFTPEDELVYQDYTIKNGEIITLGDFEIKLIGFDKELKSRNYEAKEGDIAVGANIEIRNVLTGDMSLAKPIYVIRDNVPMSIKHYAGKEGFHLRFSNIDPSTETFTFKIAKDLRDKNIKIPIAIAENVPRTDYLILEAKVFPGINLFWLGTILMMLGLLLAWIFRYLKKV